MSEDRPKLIVDCATAMHKGGRDYQEDAVLADFALGDDVGFAVLADGMGGHAAGDIASKIVVSVMFSELAFRRAQLAGNSPEVARILGSAADTANQCIADYAAAHPNAHGMGATLIAVVVGSNALSWISVGDSPLYLVRDGICTQLNADHSLAAQIDMLVAHGALTPAEGEVHPDRNVLTSVLMGETIPLVDLPDAPLPLQNGDIVISASDGLQVLSDAAIADLINADKTRSSAEIARALSDEVIGKDHDDLDNVSFAVLKVSNAKVAEQCVGLTSTRDTAWAGTAARQPA